MTRIVYNIPLQLADDYRGQRVIVRTAEPVELAKAYAGHEIERLIGVQLFSLQAEVKVLADWGYGVPLELVLRAPGMEFPALYRHAKLLDKHPMRVSIAVVPGFSRAVKLATSLEFVVKLELGQPGPEVLNELGEVLNFYLHQPLVGQPIEPFHGLLLAAYYGDPATLWDIQEENPTDIRYVTEDGHEILARRFTGASRPAPVWLSAARAAEAPSLASFITNFKQQLINERAECFGCKYFEHCGGYFKWPQQAYDCVDIKPLLRSLQEAAVELQEDLTLLLGSKEEAIQ